MVRIFPLRLDLFCNVSQTELFASPLVRTTSGDVLAVRKAAARRRDAHAGAAEHGVNLGVEDMAKEAEELEEQLASFEKQGKLLEAQRLRMRTTYDIEMMRQVGSCSGIENYSMHMDGRSRGSLMCSITSIEGARLRAMNESISMTSGATASRALKLKMAE